MNELKLTAAEVTEGWAVGVARAEGLSTQWHVECRHRDGRVAEWWQGFDSEGEAKVLRDEVQAIIQGAFGVAYASVFAYLAAGDLLAELAGIYASNRESEHEWQQGRFTGAVTCARCGLLPLDDEDRDSPCEGRVQ